MSKEFAKLCPEYAGLTWKFRVNPDSCDNPDHYQDYIRFCAIGDESLGKGTTHIFLDINDDTQEKNILGFVTLRASSLIMQAEERIQGHAALEISELAVDIRYEKQGVGTSLVDFAIAEAADLNSDHIGVEYITLCADPAAVGFYSNPNLNFISLESLYEVPREGWNDNCTPMFLKLYN